VNPWSKLLVNTFCSSLGSTLLFIESTKIHPLYLWVINHIMFFLERDALHFSLPRTLYFSLLSFKECSLFPELRLAFVFHLDFCSDLFIYLHQGVFRPLVYVGFPQKSCFKKVWMVLEKTKSFMQKSGTKRSLFRLRLRLLHAMLDCVLIVCLVIFFCSMTCLKW
jgi:hypothetical protein